MLKPQYVQEFLIKENGDYSLKEAKNALAKGIKISINLQNSMKIMKTINKTINKTITQYPIMNYLHPKVLEKAMIPENIPGKSTDCSLERQMQHNYMKYFDENLSGPLHFSEDTWKQMKFQVVGFLDECPGLDESYFFKTYLANVQLT